MIESFAKQLSSSARNRHCFFFVITLITVIGIGYHFGTFDQVFHIPYLKKSINPGLYSDDPFLDLRFFHYSYFWMFFQPFLRLGILEPAMFLAHVLATYLTFWALWELSITLFDNPLAALISTVAFIFPHISLPGFIVFEFSLLNRTFVLPFLLTAMVFYMRRRYWPAFLLLGLMYNLHVVSVSFVLPMLLLDCVLRRREIGWKNILGGLILFGIGAFPVLQWKAAHTGIDISLRPEALVVPARGMLGSIYYMISDQPNILVDTLSGIGTLLLFLTGRRANPSSHDRVMTNFVYAIGIILVVQVITTYWLPITIIIQMQILRAAFYLLIFAYLYFAHVLARCHQDGCLSKYDTIIQIGAFIVVPVPLLTWIIWIARKWIGRWRWSQITVATFLIAGMFATMMLTRKGDMWHPGLYIYGPRTPWVDAQLWAKEHTPLDTNFITPPHIFSEYVPDWRVFSERSTIATLPELQEVPFEPDYLPGWMERFEAVAPGAIEHFNYNRFATTIYTAEAFYGLSSEALLDVAREYHASYLVVEKPHLHDFPIVYENADFIIYDLQAHIK
ncbi:MAG: hypothetical protein JXB07_22015 [Anaerolineae bacterium]|nr:hypothetical protein [Anaerolineae bacterium]